MRYILFLLGLIMVYTAPAAESPAKNSPAATGEPFDVLEFMVEGNSKLPAIEIERAVYPFLGPRGGIAQVEKARTQLEKAYHDAGYLTVLVDIPEQQVMDGIVQLNVTEGKVERLRVVGSRYYSLGQIRARAPAVAEGEVPYFPEVQQQLAQLNRSNDRRVTPVLKPGRTPGTAQVDLNVQDNLPLHGSLELNDRYSANTTRLRLSGMLRYDNMWQRDHSLTLNFQTSPLDTSEVKVIVGSYLFPLPDSDKLIALYVVDSKSSVAAVGALNVIGSGTIYGARAIVPLPARENLAHSLTAGLDYKSFTDAVTVQGSDTLTTPISYAPLTAQYSATVQHGGGVTQFDLGLNFLVRGMLGNRDEEFANKRFKAHANYAYLRGNLQRTQNLPRNWSFYARVDAQFASQPLISNEQFAAGGADSVRGFLESQLLGDDALRGSLELRTPSLAGGEGALRQLNLLGFFEGAELHIKDPLPSQTKRFSLSSAGLGFRLKAWKTLTAALDVAWPFNNTPYTHVGSALAKFKLLYEF